MGIVRVMRTIILSLLIASCFALAACDTSVNVAATANVGAQYLERAHHGEGAVGQRERHRVRSMTRRG